MDKIQFQRQDCLSWSADATVDKSNFSLLEIRSNNLPNAITEAKEALKIHSGTGRLWAILIQLKQYETPEKQISVFKRALNEVPKSGEVWCEGARIALQLGNFTSARVKVDLISFKYSLHASRSTKILNDLPIQCFSSLVV